MSLNSETTNDVGIKELQARIDALYEVRERIDELEKQKSEYTKTRIKMEVEIIEIMNMLDIKNFKGQKGSFSKVEISYVNMPENDEKRAELFEHLRQTGEFDHLATIHHQRLNSWVKSKAEENGGLPPLIPGLDEPKLRYELRKGK